MFSVVQMSVSSDGATATFRICDGRGKVGGAQVWLNDEAMNTHGRMDDVEKQYFPHGTLDNEIIVVMVAIRYCFHMGLIYEKCGIDTFAALFLIMT